MRSVRLLGTVAAIAIAAGWLAPAPQAGPETPILEPAPEVPRAVERGAADVKKAQGLARKKRFAEAVAILEQVASALPSSTHDCNLALAYLRAGELTRAQLRWDLARLRTTVPPEWCTTTLAADLASSLRDKGYVPLALSIEPPTAVVDVAGVRLRKLDLLWVAPGTYTITARADGLVDGVAHVAVAAPSARAAITLVPPYVEPPAPPIDAAVEEPDAGVPPIDAAPAVEVVPVPVAPAPVRWPAYAGAGVGGVALIAAIAMHVRASGTRDDANALAAGTPAFEAARSEFGDQRAIAIGAYALSAASLGFATWWWFGHAKAEPRTSVGLSIGGDRTVVTVGWPWGGP